VERINYLKQRLVSFERDEQFGKAFGIRRLSPSFLEKARHNLVFANAAYRLSEDRQTKAAAGIDPAFAAYDWTVIAAYYSMYHAALSCLAKIGFKSENHAATAMAMEYFFVHKQKKLEKEYADLLEKAKDLEEQYVKMIWRVKEKRETAQYQVDKEAGKRAAEEALDDAAKFLKRISRLLEEIDEKQSQF